MKFGNLVLDTNKKMENIGDWFQIFAVENLYRYMKIEENQIVRIKISELSSYDGEAVILPINYPFYGYYNLSSQIIPVYLGISIIHASVVEGLRMKNFQPIGCRDYHTMKELQKIGIEAYMGGCLTITFPRMKEIAQDDKKVFIVDVSDRVLEKIPDNIKENAKYVTHMYYDDECGGREKAKTIYNDYKNARLVITSRIHCAQPCLAYGIPVIFICEVKSFRYDVIRQFLPIYEYEDMDTIDWNPAPVELETQKKKMLDNAAQRVSEMFNKYSKMYEINDFYLEGKRDNYKIDSVWAFQKYISQRWKREDAFKYALWGVTQAAEFLYEWIMEYYPKAELSNVIDNGKMREFHGRFTQNQEELRNVMADTPVFVTAGSANPVAEKVFRKYGVSKYVICYGNLYIEDGKNKSY